MGPAGGAALGEGPLEDDVPYDDAWPWDEITDAKLREDLYDRFTPYNAP